MNARKPCIPRLTLCALAVLAAVGQVRAEESADTVRALTTPDSVVSVGVGYSSGEEKDRARFGMFNGLRKDDTVLLLDFSYSKRDDPSGFWTMFSGRNLGLDNRELHFLTGRQGGWKIGADYSEITRHDPRTINTGLQGAGTTTPTVVLLPAPGTGQDLNLQLKRKGTSVSAEQWLTPNLQFEASVKNEDKNGARFFGRGFTCSSVTAPGCAGPTASATGWALLMVPEPVDSNIRQFDVKLNFIGEKLFLSGGYYGNFYSNANSALSPTVPGTLANGLGTPLPLSTGLQAILQLPIALPPDSQAHQFFLAGNYRFTPTANMTFKFSHTHATQHENFSNVFTPPPGRSNLGGVVDTTMAQIGLTARPAKNLSLLGNVRYEDRNDKTPIDLYNIEGTPTATAPATFTNGRVSPIRLTAKAEASYRFPDRIRLTIGGDFENIDHGVFTPTDNVAGISGLRQKTQEKGYRIELQRVMSETFTGSISYLSSERNGNSPWLKPYSLTATVGPQTGVFAANPDPACVPPAAPAVNYCIYNRTAIFPFIFMDRQRDKWRMSGTWMPAEDWTLQLYAEDAKDAYSGPTEHGLRNSNMRMFGADVAWTISDSWRLGAYASTGVQTVDAGHSTGYDASLKDNNTSIGLTLTGTFSPKLQGGLDIATVDDVLQYAQTQDPFASAANALFLAQQGGLPDVTYRMYKLRLFARYAIDRRSSVGVDVINYRSSFNEWTYGYNGVPFTYNDNTTLGAVVNQRVTFFGISYAYRF